MILTQQELLLPQVLLLETVVKESSGYTIIALQHKVFGAETSKI